ncbi:hypothetical protein EDEG_02768 [Edhazardia aedis USNM 41457]|uniref:Uncharacterized protein n=1 Tax=Edhazardia aedis (strain USNM 41457) TaxID=1003232 RepID=J9DN71_EDHAE|nr:hypothetical protein EDEG_02768 [Edhazardia aedis USNM 41457]|eukprot:EJW02827.1 hypothetical protein EDEG_02768 [Edhazardia aedis USNM 41457]
MIFLMRHSKNLDEMKTQSKIQNESENQKYTDHVAKTQSMEFNEKSTGKHQNQDEKKHIVYSHTINNQLFKYTMFYCDKCGNLNENKGCESAHDLLKTLPLSITNQNIDVNKLFSFCSHCKKSIVNENNQNIEKKSNIYPVCYNECEKQNSASVEKSLSEAHSNIHTFSNFCLPINNVEYLCDLCKKIEDIFLDMQPPLNYWNVISKRELDDFEKCQNLKRIIRAFKMLVMKINEFLQTNKKLS